MIIREFFLSVVGGDNGPDWRLPDSGVFDSVKCLVGQCVNKSVEGLKNSTWPAA